MCWPLEAASLGLCGRGKQLGHQGYTARACSSGRVFPSYTTSATQRHEKHAPARSVAWREVASKPRGSGQCVLVGPRYGSRLVASPDASFCKTTFPRRPMQGFESKESETNSREGLPHPQCSRQGLRSAIGVPQACRPRRHRYGFSVLPGHARLGYPDVGRKREESRRAHGRTRG